MAEKKKPGRPRKHPLPPKPKSTTPKPKEDQQLWCPENAKTDGVINTYGQPMLRSDGTDGRRRGTFLPGSSEGGKPNGVIDWGKLIKKKEKIEQWTQHIMGYACKGGRNHLESLIHNIHMGVPVKIACAAVGITYATQRLWQQIIEEDPDSEQARVYIQFFETLEIARSQAVCDVVEKLRQIADENPGRAWQALAWLLERTDQETFAIRRVYNKTQIENVTLQQAVQADPLAQAEQAALEYHQTVKNDIPEDVIDVELEDTAQEKTSD